MISQYLFLFVKGLGIGLAIAAPVGPIGLLCISRTLAHGRFSGFFSGLGAASADAVYGCIAAFGLTAVSGFLVDHKFLLTLIGGHFLLILGAKTFRKKPAATEASVKSTAGLAGHFASTFVLTITNPMTILSFAAVFVALGITGVGTYPAAVSLVAGVFTGSALWWLTLSLGVGVVRHKINDTAMTRLNRISGVVIFGFGFFALINLVL